MLKIRENSLSISIGTIGPKLKVVRCCVKLTKTTPLSYFFSLFFLQKYVARRNLRGNECIFCGTLWNFWLCNLWKKKYKSKSALKRHLHILGKETFWNPSVHMQFVANHLTGSLQPLPTISYTWNEITFALLINVIKLLWGNKIWLII